MLPLYCSNKKGGKYEMKFSEFYKVLKKSGIEFKNGTNHYFLKNPKNGKSSVVGRHPSKEIPNGTKMKILKELGLS